MTGGDNSQANDKHRARMERIAKARTDLAKRYAENPDQVQQFNVRMARLAGSAALMVPSSRSRQRAALQQNPAGFWLCRSRPPVRADAIGGLHPVNGRNAPD